MVAEHAGGGSEDTRQALIVAAGELFAQQGYDATSTRSIADAAGVNLGAIHYHFGGKEALYLACFAIACRAEESEAERIRLWAEAETRGELDRPQVQAQLVYAFTRLQVCEFLSPQRPWWQQRLLIRELDRPSSAYDRLIEDLFRRNHQHWLRLHHLVCPDGDRRVGHIWALQHAAHMVFYLQARPAVEKLVELPVDGAYIAELVAQIARSLILQLGLPLPEELQ
ncbi:MAG: CerR family C-terminal domain-containing protein [Planctomycetota bacterium]